VGKLKMMQQKGFSLIQVLIAAMLGMLLSAAVLNVLFATFQSANLKNAMHSVQEGGSLALHFIKSDINALGFSHCLEGGLSAVNIVSQGPVAAHLMAHTELVGNLYPYKKSDSITFVTTLNTGSELRQDMHAVHSSVDILDGQYFKEGQEVLITNCSSGELFSITDIWQSQLSHENSDNKEANFSHSYSRGSFVSPLVLVGYKLAKGASGRTGLFRMVSGRAQELVPDVEQLKVLYGIRSSQGTKINYVNADQVLNYKNVISVHTSLLLASEKEVLSEHMLIDDVFELTKTAPDLRYYKRFDIYLILKNRGLKDQID
jgi:type IV pilus assembly protein PilW